MYNIPRAGAGVAAGSSTGLSAAGGSEVNMDELIKTLVTASPGELENALLKLGFPPLSGQPSTDDLAAGTSASTPNLQERLQEKLLAISSLRGDAERLRKEMCAVDTYCTLTHTKYI